jgi:polar amino acid transport system substrate-binding protein
MKILLYSLFFTMGVWSTNALSQKCDSIVISGPPSGPPSSWIHKGELVGASVEFVRTIALAAGVKSVVVRPYANWSEAVNAAQYGDIDILFSAVWSQERERFLNFIQPPYSGQFLYVITQKGKSFPLRKYEDLKGRKGISGQGEAYGNSKFGAFVDAELSLERSPSITNSIKVLLEGKVDYILAYENAANSEIFRQNIGHMVSVVSTYPFYAESYIALSKRSKCATVLGPLLSKQIEIAKQKNLYHSLTSKYRSLFFNMMIETEK